jgi:tetrapyrrole methylase family protein / MazG family protein
MSADAPADDPIRRLLDIMRTLRSDGGCPWDREQTLDSLKPFLIEESHEVLDAIDSGDRAALKEELGDLLLQVVFQSRLCEEEGAFAFDDVARAIGDKLVRRHPHVFGDVSVRDTREVLRNWDAIKKSEKQTDRSSSLLDGVPRSLPALRRAHAIQHRAARVGFEWDDLPPVFEKLQEEIGEVLDAVEDGRTERVVDELGDLLFAAVNVCRFLGHDAEDALEGTIQKFVRRFAELEERVHADGRRMEDCALAELDAVWNDIKAGERGEAL